MPRNAVLAVAMAALLVLAGCGASVGPGATEASQPAEGSGTVNFYVSDQQNAIEDFEHLNVTVTMVGFHKADADDEEAEDDEETEDDEEAETEEDEEAENETDEAENETAENEPDDGDWVTREVDNVTVDLTELQGSNATLIESMELPNGTYDAVFIHVSDVNATLTDGSHPDVKLPSEKIQLHQEFTVGDGEEVDFVFDITVFERGTQGYILKPVASESGTGDDVEIDEVDDEAREDELNVSVDGNVSAGEDVTVVVSHDGEAVENATVEVDGEAVGQTNADGELVVTIPEDSEEIEIEATAGEREGSYEAEFGEDESDAAEEGDDNADESDDNAGNDSLTQPAL